MRNVESLKNKTKSVYTAFDSVSLIGFQKLVISRSERKAGFSATAGDVFNKRRKDGEDMRIQGFNDC